MVVARKVDATGRSTGQIDFKGKAKRWTIKEGFVPLTRDLMTSPAFKALSVPARHILDFLMVEHMNSGGAENGLLLAPYLQLEAFGMSNRDVKPALDMLEAFGLIRRTEHGQRQGGRPNATRYALTWLPTADGAWPTGDFKKVTVSDVEAFLAEIKRTKANRKARKVERQTESNRAGMELNGTRTFEEGAASCMNAAAFSPEI